MIDWERVADLRAEIGDDGFDEVVDLFLEETDDVASGLGALHSAAEIEAALHFLKGSALNLGFADLAALCQEGERAAAQGDAAGVDLRRVRAVYAETRAAFMAHLRPAAA